VYDLDETLIGRSSVDVVVAVSPSPDLVYNVSPNPLNIFHACPSCSLPSPSLKCCDLSPIDSHAVLERNEVDCFNSPGTFKGYNPSLDPYSLYLEDMLEKSCSLLYSNLLLIFPRHLISLEEYLLLFLDLCLGALTCIHLSCTLKCSISSCEL